MAAPFIGNQDYRGYLNYLSQNSTDPTYKNPARTLLNLGVGNDAGFANPNVASGDLGTRNQQLYQQYLGLNNPTTSLPSIYGGGGGGPAPVYAPKLDVAAINSQARSAAENAVNPFYTKQLNDFLAQQSAAKQQQQTQYDTNVQNLQDTLKNTQEANALTQQRTAEDTATKLGQVNTANDQNQVDTGNQFENARLAEAKAQATNGILGSGAGNRQTAVATTARNSTEQTQNDQFQAQRDQQNLFKSRTFADLAKSNEQAATAETKGEKQAKFDLDSYIQNAGFTEQNQRNQLEEQRLQRVASEQQNQAKLLFNNYLAGISNPAQYEAAVRTYGGSF